MASFFRGVKSCSPLCKKSPPSAWAPPATSEYHDQHPLGESSVVRWQSNINMSRLHRKYILASLIFGTFNRNSTRSISVMESPWYKCCVWTGLGWGLLVYYSRDTASRKKTTHLQKYIFRELLMYNCIGVPITSFTSHHPPIISVTVLDCIMT